MKAIGVVVLSSLLWVVPAGASDFELRLSWDRESDVHQTEARPGDTLLVYVHMESLEMAQRLVLDDVAFGIWSSYPLTHLESKPLGNDLAVAWDQRDGHGLVTWSALDCGVRVRDTIEAVSEHAFLVGAPPARVSDHRVSTFSPGYGDPELHIWSHEDCSGDLCTYTATPDCLKLGVSVSAEASAWGGVKSLYRVP